MTGWAGSPDFIPCVDVPSTSDALGVKESSLRAGKWISSCSQSPRLLSGRCLAGAMARLDRRGRLQNKNVFEADDVTHSLVFFDDIDAKYTSTVVLVMSTPL